MNIVIVDYGCSNIKSVRNALSYIGFDSIVSNEVRDVFSADIIILPGVGSYDVAISSLKANGLDICIRNKVSSGTPIIGICLGFQLLFEGSEEGKLQGLSIEKGFFRRFESKKVNMGWRSISGCSPLTTMIDKPRYYFVHSYYLPSTFKSEEDLISQYNGEDFVCGVSRGNVFGVQFHPEKSHKYGLKLLKNFIELHK
ncbi:imidazole glycerol phosphate synthase subunit HisH [Vibrio sp. 10N.261.55.A7]|uniref:imidazole glycerol phosphate synthase subunit HisH n=1 Tax=Vibrio sp. 10N.261.55.A7 TaxID=1880851 RepID=UPI000C8352ED|nr:imidazole glycerol phosphate synthase subunit HisH [Vibrio sp. 10N.261.55.A7]PMK05028.1 imidazole glycerol phosphate synthase, glutamine amidotransferase subunit [Vibrio sp. 10N.261.55.A7]